MRFSFHMAQKREEKKKAEKKQAVSSFNCAKLSYIKTIGFLYHVTPVVLFLSLSLSRSLPFSHTLNELS